MMVGGCGGTGGMMDPDPVPCDETSSPAKNLAVNGIATTSHQGMNPLANVFDGNSGTAWAAQYPTPWIAYEFMGTAAHAVTTYAITAAADGVTGTTTSDPSTWEFQGATSESGAAPESIDWVTLDTRVDEVFETRYLTRTFSFSNTTEYQRHRLLVAANGGAPEFKIAELALFGPGTPTFSIDTVSGNSGVQFDFSNGWNGHTVDNASARYDGTSSWCNVPNEFAQVTFVGSQIRLYAVTDPAHGIAGISIDGGAEVEADLYGPLAFNQLVFTSRVLCPGEHILQARVTGRKNSAAHDIFVSIDRAQVTP